MKSMVMALTILLTGGCAFVTSPVIVGNTPLDIESARTAWEGTWMLADGATVSVKVLDGTNGVLQVGLIQDDDDGNMRFNAGRVYLRKASGWTFATFKNLDKAGEPYLWARIKKRGRQCILWLPSPDKFRTLVEAGRVPGKTHIPQKAGKRPNVELMDLKSEHLELITSETHGMLFIWDAPLVLWKISE